MIDVIHLSTIDSTQDETVRMLAGGRMPPFAVLADTQIKGRGRQGRQWESPIGNLSATTVLPIVPTERAGDYAFIVAVSMHAAIAPQLSNPADLRLKWPNDLLLGGQKCAGILLERPDPAVLLIGTGVNVVAAPADRTFLNAHTAMPFTAPALLGAFHAELLQCIDVYQTAGLPPILDAWRTHAFGLGQEINVRLAAESFMATFMGLDEDGALIAQLPNGTKRLVHAGEVFFTP